MNYYNKPLFIFEMANNHMGSLEHGLKMIKEFAQIKKTYETDFHFAFKFQFRNIDTFIHPDYKNRMDLRYIKRFSETKLSKEQFYTLKESVREYGFLSMCTGFDEASIDLIEEMNFDIIKIASCSFTDWLLLERIIKLDKPIIASTAGTDLIDIDNVVSFFLHREKNLCLMHCVGEYPTNIDRLQLNQIDLFKSRYPDIQVGFSTHEEPENFDSIKIAVSKGVRVFEKHVAVVTNEYPKNEYSATPEQVKKWLESAKQAFRMCGVIDKRAEFSDKELADLLQFKRGMFASTDIKKGDILELSKVFFAFPNQANQLLANDFSKYTKFVAQRDIQKNEPVLENDVQKILLREKVYTIVQKVKELLYSTKIVFPGKADLEISHHYGIDKFYEFGLTMITVVNRDYCKKLLIVLPNQVHPEQYHKQKEETFIMLYGELEIELDGEKSILKPGDLRVVKPGVKHIFRSQTGAVFEEISSTHFVNDSFYTDESITKNQNRKTILSYWL